jgi:hypothetical protein
VVFLGFGMDLPVVLRTGLQGAGLAAATIATTLGLGWALGKRLGIDRAELIQELDLTSASNKSPSASGSNSLAAF